MDTPLPNLRHLRIFLAVCYLKSTVRAAQHMQLSQPAITQAIAKLEIFLNATLFERHTDGMTPSTIGQRFQRRIERALTWLDASIAALQPAKIVTSGQLHKLTTTQLTALIAVHDYKNFSAASRALNIAQSSVYRSAKEIEKLLQIELFHATMTSSLTHFGQSLIHSAKLVFNEIRQGMLDIDSPPTQSMPNLRIGCPTPSQEALLSDTLIRFEQHHQPLRLLLENVQPTDAYQQLANGELDFLIDEAKHPLPSPDFEVETLPLPSLTFACHERHPLLKQHVVQLSDLSDFDWVIPEHLPAQTVNSKELLADAVIRPTRLMQTGSTYLARRLILNSDRITWVYSNQLKHDSQLKALVKVPPSLCLHPRTARLITRKTWLPTQTQSHFLDTLREVASHNAEL